MKRTILAIAAVSFSMLAAAASPKSGKAAVGRAIKSIEDSFGTYDAMQKDIWGYHEIRFKEYRSSARLSDYLERQGFKLERGVAGLSTAFVAKFGEGHPVIGILAEYDALAGLSQDTVSFRKPLEEGQPGHGCGHNLIGTGSVAAATALKQWMEETGQKGTICVFGTPAEEGGSGKTIMADAGVFDGTDAVLDWHPGSHQYVYVNPWLDKCTAVFRFHGKASHAAAHPDQGRSAFAAAELFMHSIALMRMHVPQGVKLFYSVADSGPDNIVTEDLEVTATVRGRNWKDVSEAMEWVKQAARGAAMATQTSVSSEVISSSRSKLHNRTIATLLQEKLELVGLPRWDDRETAFARDIYETQSKSKPFANIYSIEPLAPEMPYGTGGSSDVGNVSWVVPEGGFEIQTFIPGSSGHSWQNTAVAGTTIGTKGLIAAAKVLLLAAIDLYTQPALLQSAIDEFNSKKQ